MSYNNSNKSDPKKVYSILDKPPVFECGGKKDKEGIDLYWGKSLTLQADEQNANIHFILERYQKTGALTAMIKENPQYGDFTQVPTYQESLNIVLKANEQFNNLDAKIRARFANDPTQFLNFVHDPNNKEELIKMGLANAPQTSPAIPVAEPKAEKP